MWWGRYIYKVFLLSLSGLPCDSGRPPRGKVVCDKSQEVNALIYFYNIHMFTMI